jgi:hypothetical protein
MLFEIAFGSYLVLLGIVAVEDLIKLKKGGYTLKA